MGTSPCFVFCGRPSCRTLGCVRVYDEENAFYPPAIPEIKCGFEIPGVGPCEVVGLHTLDGALRLIHKRGPVTWNGDPPRDPGKP